MGYGHYKKQLLGLVLDTFKEARIKRQQLAQDEGYVRHVLLEGQRKAQAMAQGRLSRVLGTVGCGPGAR